MGVLRPRNKLTKRSSSTSSGSDPGRFKALRHAQPPEAPRIDKAQFASRSQRQRSHGYAWQPPLLARKPAPARSFPDEQSTARWLTACAGLWSFCFCAGHFATWRPPAQHSKSNTMCFPTRRTCAIRRRLKRGGNLSGGRFQRLGLRSQPDRFNNVSRDTLARPRAMVSTSGSSGMENSLQSLSSAHRQPWPCSRPTTRRLH